LCTVKTPNELLLYPSFLLLNRSFGYLINKFHINQGKLNEQIEIWRKVVFLAQIESLLSPSDKTNVWFDRRLRAVRCFNIKPLFTKFWCVKKSTVYDFILCVITEILELKSSINLSSPYSGKNLYLFSYILTACLILEPMESKIDFPCFASYVIWLYFN
jgi:hypothetical protein